MADFSFSVIWEAMPLLLKGAGLTLVISGLAMFFAIVIGMAAASLYSLGSSFVQMIIWAYVEFFRNTPLLIQLFFGYFCLPQLGITLAPFAAGLLALTLYASAYNIEVFRAGLNSVPKGQYEAARALGLSRLQILMVVTGPQAFRNAFPALGNNLISLIKNSALVSTIGMVDLMFIANDVSANNFRSFEMYASAVVLYVLINLGMTKVLQMTEVRLSPRRASCR